MLPTILSTETTVVRDDAFGEEVVLNVQVTGTVTLDGDVLDVRLRTAMDDRGGEYVKSVGDLSWPEQMWAEDGLEGAWEDLYDRYTEGTK